MTNKQRVLEAVQRDPGRTSAEYSLDRELGLDRYEVARRLADLKNDGKVVQLTVRRCEVKGTDAVTWGYTQ